MKNRTSREKCEVMNEIHRLLFQLVFLWLFLRNIKFLCLTNTVHWQRNCWFSKSQIWNRLSFDNCIISVHFNSVTFCFLQTRCRPLDFLLLPKSVTSNQTSSAGFQSAVSDCLLGLYGSEKKSSENRKLLQVCIHCLEYINQILFQNNHKERIPL